ncbi:FixH family protein [Oceanobacillus kapialis]|uniref:FixH family protein n=1 Tax=Oceanobacillus kapialis TaxID=481353 RepID=UPI00384EB2B5
MKKLWFLVLLVVFMMMAACGNAEEENQAESEDEVHTLDVEFTVPENAKEKEAIELTAQVTYGEEKVSDAEVVFEIWEKGKEDESWEIEPTNNEDGTFSAETSFEEDGVYEMYAHTDAKGLHNMPKKSITVGNGKKAEEAHVHASKHEETNEGHEHDHGESTDGFSLHFATPENVEMGNSVELLTHLQLDDKAMEEANVRYEIWLDGEEKHDWIDAEEQNPGEYSTSHTFEENGTYHVIIHVENDSGLHEHEEHEIKVQ